MTGSARRPVNRRNKMGMRIAIGCDDAGIEYKKVLKADLAADPRVDEVIDVGVHEGEHTAYPHLSLIHI